MTTREEREELAERIARKTRQGESAAEIARQLWVSKRTVERHRQRLAEQEPATFVHSARLDLAAQPTEATT